MSQNKPIKGCYPLKVEEIIFEDGSSMREKTVLLCGDFVVVADDNGGAPTLYNSRKISELRRVEEIRPQSKSTVIW